MLTNILLIAAIIVVGAAAAWLGRAYGKRIRRGAMMGFVLLGFGTVVDPPSRHASEAAEKEADSESNGEPKD